VLHSHVGSLASQSRRVLGLTDSDKIELVVNKFNLTV